MLSSICSPASASIGAERLLETRRWLDRIVIGAKLCPFAPPVQAANKLKLRDSAASSADGIVMELAEEAAELRDGSTGVETSLLVLGAMQDGRALSWQELIYLSWQLQEEVIVAGGHAEHLQIVCFHPEATHSLYADAGAPPDAADYTIRSPHPTVQLLREVDVVKAVQQYPDTAGIPGRNRTRLRAEGLEVCASRLQSCRVRALAV